MSLRSDEELIQALLDGELDARAFEQLERRMAAEPELRALYRSYSRMTGVLGEKFALSGVEPARKPRRSHRPALALAACAAALGVAVVFLLPEEKPAVEVSFGPESHGRIVHRAGVSGDDTLLPGSKVELDHGSVSIALGGDSHAYFEGPGTLEFLGENGFRLGEGRVLINTAGPARCHSRDFEVRSEGGRFGLIVDHIQRQELNVLDGAVELAASDGSRQRLERGISARWDGQAVHTGQPRASFASAFPTAVTIFEETFDESDLPLAGKIPDIGDHPWTVEKGGPVIQDGVLDTSGNERHAAFVTLGEPMLDDLSHVLLLSLETDNPETSRFHSKGWAGVSLYTGDEERIFVGDPNGPEQGWALHPAGYNARHACPLLEGKTTVTLRYDYRSGLAQLFEGTDTSGPALASEWIAPRLNFDRLRIANGSQVDAAIDAGMDPSVAGDGPDVNVRGDIALRRIRVSILSSEDETAP